MNTKRLPLLYVNDIDINSLFASLFTQSNITSEVRGSGLYAFSDPMFMFSQIKDGLVMSFGGKRHFCESCSHFPFRVAVRPVAGNDLYLVATDVHVLIYTYMVIPLVYDSFLVYATGVYVIQDKQDYYIRFNAGGWMAYISPSLFAIRYEGLSARCLERALYEWIRGKRKRVKDYIQEIENVRLKLQTAQQQGGYSQGKFVPVKDRVIFDGFFVADAIQFQKVDQTRSYWFIAGIVFLSLPTVRPHQQCLQLSAGSMSGNRIPISKALIDQAKARRSVADRMRRLWCELLPQFLNMLAQSYMNDQYFFVVDSPFYRYIFDPFNYHPPAIPTYLAFCMGQRGRLSIIDIFMDILYHYLSFVANAQGLVSRTPPPSVPYFSEFFPGMGFGIFDIDYGLYRLWGLIW